MSGRRRRAGDDGGPTRFRIDTPRRSDAAEAGVDLLPRPTSQVLFHGRTEETGGDRDRQRGGRLANGREVPWPRSRVAAQENPEPPSALTPAPEGR